MIENDFPILKNALTPQIASGVVSIDNESAINLFNDGSVGDSRPATMNLFDSLTAFMMPSTLTCTLFFGIGLPSSSLPLSVFGSALWRASLGFIASVVGFTKPLTPFLRIALPAGLASFVSLLPMRSEIAFVYFSALVSIGMVILANTGAVSFWIGSVSLALFFCQAIITLAFKSVFISPMLAEPSNRFWFVAFSAKFFCYDFVSQSVNLTTRFVLRLGSTRCLRSVRAVSILT